MDSIDFSHLSSVVLVTGLSGAGKSTASKVLSDLGFYTIDNLPVGLLAGFTGISKQDPSRYSSSCLLIDIDSTRSVQGFLDDLEDIRKAKCIRTIFLDCTTETIVKRYSETRRPHPYFDPHRDGTLSDTVDRERGRLLPLRERSDFVIDTSDLNVHDLKRELTRIAGEFSQDISSLIRINFLSFGFKYGPPFDCDLLIDVRFLPNPYFIEELRPKTGQDTEVASYVLEQENAREFLTRYISLLEFLIPHYIFEGKAYLNIGVGCTGGKHRSVAIAESLAKSLNSEERLTGVKHRDIMR